MNPFYFPGHKGPPKHFVTGLRGQDVDFEVSRAIRQPSLPDFFPADKEHPNALNAGVHMYTKMRRYLFVGRHKNVGLTTSYARACMRHTRLQLK